MAAYEVLRVVVVLGAVIACFAQTNPDTNTLYSVSSSYGILNINYSNPVIPQSALKYTTISSDCLNGSGSKGPGCVAGGNSASLDSGAVKSFQNAGAVSHVITIKSDFVRLHQTNLKKVWLLGSDYIANGNTNDYISAAMTVYEGNMEVGQWRSHDTHVLLISAFDGTGVLRNRTYVFRLQNPVLGTTDGYGNFTSSTTYACANVTLDQGSTVSTCFRSPSSAISANSKMDLAIAYTMKDNGVRSSYYVLVEKIVSDSASPISGCSVKKFGYDTGSGQYTTNSTGHVVFNATVLVGDEFYIDCGNAGLEGTGRRWTKVGGTVNVGEDWEHVYVHMVPTGSGDTYSLPYNPNYNGEESPTLPTPNLPSSYDDTFTTANYVDVHSSILGKDDENAFVNAFYYYLRTTSTSMTPRSATSTYSYQEGNKAGGKSNRVVSTTCNTTANACSLVHVAAAWNYDVLNTTYFPRAPYQSRRSTPLDDFEAGVARNANQRGVEAWNCKSGVMGHSYYDEDYLEAPTYQGWGVANYPTPLGATTFVPGRIRIGSEAGEEAPLPEGAKIIICQGWDNTQYPAVRVDTYGVVWPNFVSAGPLSPPFHTEPWVFCAV